MLSTGSDAFVSGFRPIPGTVGFLSWCFLASLRSRARFVVCYVFLYLVSLCACLKRGSLGGERCGEKEMDSIVHSHKEPAVYLASGNECKTT